MFSISLMILLFAFNLIHVAMQKDTIFYKDLRFWIVFFSLIALIVLATKANV